MDNAPFSLVRRHNLNIVFHYIIFEYKMKLFALFLNSSVVELSASSQLVVGSNPTYGDQHHEYIQINDAITG